MARRKKSSPGNVLRIDLGEGQHAYGQMCADGSMAFFDHLTANELTIPEIIKLPVAFRVHVYNYVPKNDRWPSVGSGDLQPQLLEEPFKFMQDVFFGRLSIYHSSYAATHFQRPASLDECRGLECVAVWGANHVEDRLRDHFNGVENFWLKSMAIDESKVPADQK